MTEKIAEFIVNDALILAPALWVLGTFMKNTPKVPDWFIPWALVVLGMAGGVALLGLSPQSIVQGILVAGVAVLVHQLKVQTQHKRNE